jgi:class I lanthipeptide synthase
VTPARPVVGPPPEPPAGAPEGWAESLFTGAAGIALLHIERAHDDAAEWSPARRWVGEMAGSPVTAHPDASGLHRGAPAVAYVLHRAGQPGYAAALATLDDHIARLTRDRLTRAHARIDAGELPALAEFDLIRGLTGIGVYLLARHPSSELTATVLAYLVRLTKPLSASGQTVPGWWTDHAPNDRPSPRWPGGHANHGLAHGVTGPLALLSLALRRGTTVPGHADAIARICSWLDRWSVPAADDTDAVWWPESIAASELRSGASSQPGPGRPSWCYGTPGIARAQQLAGHALGDADRRRLAEHAFAACLHDQRQLNEIRDATVCHGWAGLLLTAWRTAAEASNPDRFPLRALGIRLQEHLDRHGQPAGDGLLEGATGVQLVQHTVAAAKPLGPGWDSCLLLTDASPARPSVGRPRSAISEQLAQGDR